MSNEAEWRKEAWSKVYKEKKSFKRSKEQTTLKRDYDQLHNYGERMMRKVDQKNTLLDHISQMEKVEEQMIGRLRDTQK